MAYSFDETVSYSRARRYASQVIGGLAARPVLAAQVVDWRAMKQRIRIERDQREDADDLIIETSTATRVDDVDFDFCLTKTSGRSWELSGKDASAEPHATLFGKVPAKRARSFGPAKATEVGLRVVKDGRKFALPELEASLAELEAATAVLGTSFKAFEDAEDALFTPRQAKKKLVRALNLLIATTEAAVLTAFPGREDIVSAILLPWFERKNGKTAKGEPDPLAPAVDDRDAGDEDDETRET